MKGNLRSYHKNNNKNHAQYIVALLYNIDFNHIIWRLF